MSHYHVLINTQAENRLAVSAPVLAHCLIEAAQHDPDVEYCEIKACDKTCSDAISADVLMLQGHCGGTWLGFEGFGGDDPFIYCGVCKETVWATTPDPR